MGGMGPVETGTGGTLEEPTGGQAGTETVTAAQMTGGGTMTGMAGAIAPQRKRRCFLEGLLACTRVVLLWHKVGGRGAALSMPARLAHLIADS